MEEEIDKNNGRDMTPKLIGETYLKKATATSSQRCRYGLYECAYCGIHWECKTTKINNNITKGCGCQRGKGFKHGLESNRFYNTWKHMGIDVVIIKIKIIKTMVAEASQSAKNG